MSFASNFFFGIGLSKTLGPLNVFIPYAVGTSNNCLGSN